MNKRSKHLKKSKKQPLWPWILIAGIAAAVLVVFAVQRLHPDVDHMLYPRKYESIV